YDVYNNLLSLTTNGSTLTTSVNASTNRLTSFSATYDAAGNLTRQVRASETHQYTYDPLGMPKYLQSTTDQAQVHLYDADDERLATYDCFPGVCDSPGWELRTTVRGLGGEPLREYSTRGTNGWQWVRDYVYRAGGLLAVVEPNGSGGETVYHLHTDHLGTPRQITNASGVQVALHSYYPFGQEATDPAQTAFTKKFTGHERDSNGTGTAGDLDYMHARYCSPTLGRFLSFDPIGGNPRAPQSWNRYAYALNSPMNYTDPEGLFAQLFLDLYFVVFDEITVTASSYSSLLGYFYRLGSYFSEGVRPSIYGEMGRPTPPAAGAYRGLFEGDELERVRFGMSYGAIDTGGVPEFVIFLPMGRIYNALRGSALRAGSTTARAGTYILKDPVTGNVVRTGRTNNLSRRAAEHSRDPTTSDLVFEAIHRTNNPAAQRGLEQMLHEKFSPPLNKINPISPRNPNRATYMEAAEAFLGGGGTP
ncbi:MAG: hypothetical protein HC897_20105, partial [Thermoanaerobaculia bacterium]|nr:hypothetical protein [Thermoanaerobaculia bacterium]